MKLSVDQLRSSMLVRRHNVVALAFVLCAWLITAAMHLHLADKEQGGPGADPRHCSYCLVSATGAAPLPDYSAPKVVIQPVAVAVSYDLPAHQRVAPSFYFSRGPPAV